MVETDFFQGRKIRRVLIYRLGSFGDTVVALPSLHLIARTFPNATRALLTNLPVHAKAPSMRAVLGDSGLVHEYINYKVGTRSPVELAQTWCRIRSFDPDILIYLALPRGPKSLRRDLLFFRACGIRTIVGAPLGELASPRYDHQTELWEHESVRTARTLEILGDADPFDVANWDLKLQAAEIDRADQFLSILDGRPFLAGGIGTKMQAKDWGADKWQALIRKMTLRFPNHALVFVGAKEDYELSQFAGRDWKGTALNLCGELTPRETAAVLRRAELFVGPDSGPMHLAASLGIPCANAFSARGKPGHWYPFGAQHQVVYHKTECFDCGLEVCVEQRKKCIESIQVDEVFDAVLRAWQHGSQVRALNVLTER